MGLFDIETSKASQGYRNLKDAEGSCANGRHSRRRARPSNPLRVHVAVRPLKNKQKSYPERLIAARLLN
jgi:hypothetical protein